MLNWLASIGRQVLRAFGLGPKAEPFAWGVTLHDIATARGTAASEIVVTPTT